MNRRVEFAFLGLTPAAMEAKRLFITQFEVL